MHVAGIIVSLAEFEDEMLGKPQQIIEYFDAYTKKLLLDNKLEPCRKVFERSAGGFGSFGYQGKGSPGFKEIYEVIEQATLAAFSTRMAEESKNLLGRLRSDSEVAYSALYEYEEDKGNYADAPLLQNVPIENFVDLLIIDSSPNDRLFASLATRYEHDVHTKALQNEHEWVRKLHRELKDRIAKEKSPFKKILELRVGYYFKKIMEAIETKE